LWDNAFKSHALITYIFVPVLDGFLFLFIQLLKVTIG
jgi:hypothetical protein